MEGSVADQREQWDMEYVWHMRDVAAKEFARPPRLLAARAEAQDLPLADLEELHDAIEHECPYRG